MKYAYLIWKNLWRKKTRTILTVLSIFVAFILYGLLGALDFAFNSGAQLANAKRLVTIHKVSLIQSLPISYLERIRQTPGVADVTHADWFGGYYQDPRNQFPQFPVEPESYLRVYSEITLPDAQRENWLANRTGAIVGRAVAEQYGFKVGDRIPIQAGIYPKSDGGRTWEFEIDGIFDTDDARGNTAYMLFHYDYFDEARAFGQDSAGWYIFEVSDPTQAEAVAAAIDQGFANSPAETKTSTEAAFAESFAKQFGDIGLIISAVLGAVFFTILLVASNTMAQAVRERIPEMAVLKTLGFRDSSVLGLVLAESITIALLGGLTGLGLAWVLIGGLASAFAAFLPSFYLPGETIVKGLLVMLGVGFISGIFPALQAKRLTIVDALGRL
ncbi:MAG: ABC transporter permease [Gammaproteobacteria bacterium]